MQLTVVAIRNAKGTGKPYKMADGGGLYLLVTAKGAKLWRFDYRFDGKRKTLALGQFPDVGLADAREAREEARKQIRSGADPSEKRREDRRKAAAPKPPAFRDVAFAWYEARSGAWVAGYGARVWSRVDADVVALIGDKPIEAVQADDLLEALRRIEGRGAVETAHRVRTYLEDIFKFARAAGLVTSNPAVELGDALAAPPPPKRRAALKARDLPDFVKALSAYDGDEQTHLALKLTLLTFVRTSEVRFARWDEFEHLDGEEPLWRIPAERMKMRTEHLVPLAPQAVEVIEALRPLARGSRLVFPSPTRSGVMSENTMLFALYRMGYHSRATVHGFRGTASTILNETGFNRDWIERQLAHVERDDVRAAYNAAEWLPQRREMMIWWANYLDGCVHSEAAPAESSRP